MEPQIDRAMGHMARTDSLDNLDVGDGPMKPIDPNRAEQVYVELVPSDDPTADPWPASSPPARSTRSGRATTTARPRRDERSNGPFSRVAGELSRRSFAGLRCPHPHDLHRPPHDVPRHPPRPPAQVVRHVQLPVRRPLRYRHLV